MRVSQQWLFKCITKSGSLFLFLIISFFPKVNAQNIQVGIKAGTNISNILGRSFEGGFQWGFSGGAFAELKVSKKWGLQSELMFNAIKAQTAGNFNLIYLEGVPNRSISLNYLSLPVLLTYKPIPLLSFQAGPQFGLLMNTSQNIMANGGKTFKTGDFSLVAGVQLDLDKFKTGIRYVYGLTNINHLGDIDPWKIQGFQVYLGLRIF
jgi:Outer membrane protein beta-barrel domain